VPTTTIPLPRDGHLNGHEINRPRSTQPPRQSPGSQLGPVDSRAPPHHDVLGIRGNAVALNLGGTNGERKPPWWLEDAREEEYRARERDKHDRENREAKDKEGVSR
jgi:hypothetical protein